MYETENDLIVIDTGFMLPSSDMPGVDLIFPDIHYLVERKRDSRNPSNPWTRGPYWCFSLRITAVRCPQSTAHSSHLRSQPEGCVNTAYSASTLNTIAPGDTVELGDFSAEFIHVTHSIPDSVAIALRTPVGVIVHTGDFKFDMTPIDGKLSDVQTLARLGSEGVQLLVSDSTNAERPGQTPSERVSMIR